MRRALKGVHATERQLLAATQQGARKHLLRLLSSLQAMERAAGIRAITAKYADKLARAFDGGDAKAAYAARARLQLEEAIEIANFDLTSQKSGATSRQANLAGLRVSQKSERIALSDRHRHERAHLAIVLTGFVSAGRPARLATHRARVRRFRWLRGRRNRLRPTQRQ